MKYVVIYLLLINILGAVLTVYDKFAAKRGLYRISEKNLLTLSALGGSVSIYAVMLTIRHKTLHKKFMLGIPVIIILQILFVVFCLNKFA